MVTRFVKCFVMLLCLAAACHDDKPLARSVSPLALVPPGSVQVVIQQDPSVTGDTAVFIVQIVPNGVPIAAYQGVATFSPEIIEVLSVRTPEAKDGSFRVVNSQEIKAGRIRFAGFAADALTSSEAFRIIARMHGAVAGANIVGALDVVGQNDGQAVAPTHLHRSAGVYDANTNARLAP